MEKVVEYCQKRKPHHHRTKSLPPLRSSTQWVEDEPSKLEYEEGGDVDDKFKNIRYSSSSSSSTK
jgi:hypothetical protein